MVLSGCKNASQVAGEGTNYPVTWKESSGGKVTVKLDGSVSPDYSWDVVSTNEEILKVETKKEEKNGIITYTISPVSEGSATIQISRKRAAGPTMEEIKAALDEMKSADEDESESVYVWDLLGEPVDVTEGAFTMSGEGEREVELKIPDDESVVVNRIETSGASEEDECEQYLMQDNICDVSLQVSVMPVKKKYKASMENVTVAEHTGLSHGGDETFSYDFWNVGNDLMVRMGGCPYGCIVNVEMDYTGDGEYEEGMTLAEVIQVGIIKDWTYYRVTGWDDSNGYLYFENPALKKRLAALVNVDHRSLISVVSAELEDYKPSKEDIDEMTERSKEVLSDKEDKSKEGQEMPSEETSEGVSEGETEETPEEEKEGTSEAGQ